VIPNTKPGEDWQAYSVAFNDAFLSSRLRFEPNPYTVAWQKILDAYADGKTDTFNHEVKTYRQMLADKPPEQLAMTGHWYDAPLRPVTDFEAYFNHFSPFIQCGALYLLAFILTVVGMAFAVVGWNKPFRRAALALIFVTFLVHSLALLARMYISGRPPVTNLYSSAIFIGWGAVGLCMVLEVISRLGIGNLVGSVIGLLTMIIAYFLAGDGDTLIVMQAVLDTQFWLATHVVSITLGYTTTFVAGLLGIITIIYAFSQRFVSLEDAQPVLRIFHKLTFGVVCFAILFSFVGTVLGGLWADDSWGRFWGWDPKENGAAMIVIWNAVLLHARWDRIVANIGFAILAVLGNIVTAWSWFGVNELGVGLHSYGFTEGVLFWLGVFVASQLLIVGVGIFMTRPMQRLLGGGSGPPANA
jgi:ABC-type transport system involved in cytochrome c biogenesis permease subunit